MLEHIFGSKTRAKLLKIFFSYHNHAFFIRELTRVIDTQINSVRRELDNLRRCGVLRVLKDEEMKLLMRTGRAAELALFTREGALKAKNAKERQPKKFFTVNKNFVLFRELKNVFLKSPLLFQEKFIKELKGIEGVDCIVLAGFFVQDDSASVDLLIVGSASKARLAKVVSMFEKEFEHEINFTHMTHEEFEYRKSLTDRFLYRVLEGKKIVAHDAAHTVS